MLHSATGPIAKTQSRVQRGPNGQKTVNIYDPSTVFSDRLNQLDIRFSKILDVYNSFNSDAQLALNTTYSGVNGGTWLRPTSLIQGGIIMCYGAYLSDPNDPKRWIQACFVLLT